MIASFISCLPTVVSYSFLMGSGRRLPARISINDAGPSICTMNYDAPFIIHREYDVAKRLRGFGGRAPGAGQSQAGTKPENNKNGRPTMAEAETLSL